MTTTGRKDLAVGALTPVLNRGLAKVSFFPLPCLAAASREKRLAASRRSRLGPGLVDGVGLITRYRNYPQRVLRQVGCVETTKNLPAAYAVS